MIRLILRTRNDRLNLAFLWTERIKSRMGEEKFDEGGNIAYGGRGWSLVAAGR